MFDSDPSEPLMEEHFILANPDELLLEISSFDHQLLVAINGTIVMEPWPIASKSDSPSSMIENSPNLGISRV